MVLMLGIEAENTKKSLTILLIPRSMLGGCIATSINTDTYPHRPYAGIMLPHKRCRRRSKVVADVAAMNSLMTSATRVAPQGYHEDFSSVVRISGAVEEVD